MNVIGLWSFVDVPVTADMLDSIIDEQKIILGLSSYLSCLKRDILKVTGCHLGPDRLATVTKSK